MNKYYRLLDRILIDGKTQTGRKGTSRYLLNESLSLTPADLLDIFEGHNIARRKLGDELRLFMNGERSVEKYREAGISWWDYCGHTLVNSYPTYFEKLPPLIDRINREKRSSKNYVLFLGSTGAETNQAPCLSLVQFQIDGGELVLSAYQRSSDANLGLPADIYHLYRCPGKSICPCNLSPSISATCTSTTTTSPVHGICSPETKMSNSS